jgi:hypothetical protein
VAEGAFDLSTAQAPATCGVAIDVPEKVWKLPPGTEELIHRPGASRFKKEALLEKPDTTSTVVPRLPSSVEPTLIALEIQAGYEIPFVLPSFPDAITVAMPSERRLSMAAFIAGFVLSQFVVRGPPPRLILTAATLKLPLSCWIL